MAKKAKRHSLCTVLRTVKVTHGTMSMVGEPSTTGRSEIVTQPCGTPLFNEEHIRTGICRSCAAGWEVKDNRFANAKEKARAGRRGR